MICDFGFRLFCGVVLKVVIALGGSWDLMTLSSWAYDRTAEVSYTILVRASIYGAVCFR